VGQRYQVAHAEKRMLPLKAGAFAFVTADAPPLLFTY
jgi:hypothetical protein